MLLRPAEPEDAMAVAHVHVRSWQAAYRGLIPDAFLDGLRPEDRAQRYDFANQDPLKPKTILAIEQTQILGFATIAPSRDPDLPVHGELCALYADPSHWNRGVGVALILAARTQLFDQGFRSAFLWLLAGNTRAARFYQRDGWQPDGRNRIADVWGLALSEMRYVRETDARA